MSAGLELRVGQRGADDGLLRRAVRNGEPAAAAIGIHRGSADHGEDRIAGRRAHSTSRLSAMTPQPSPRTNAVGRGIEGLAPAVRRHHSPLREQHHGVRLEDDVDATGEREIAFARAQALTRKMYRDE